MGTTGENVARPGKAPIREQLYYYNGHHGVVIAIHFLNLRHFCKITWIRTEASGSFSDLLINTPMIKTVYYQVTNEFNYV